jgi:hypothetical protein
MLPHLDVTLPVVVIYNNLEAFYPFLRKADDPQVIGKRFFRGDRALFWLGADKLVITSRPVDHLAYVRQELGYTGTDALSPITPSPFLSFDILREAWLRERLVAYAGTGRAVQLVPYATTREFLHLAAVLRHEWGLRVLLVESPAPEACWVRDYADTKSGFRALAGACLPDADRLLPEGVICKHPAQAAEVARWFGGRGQACVIKADGGESGIGHVLMAPAACEDGDAVAARLDTSPFLRDDLIIVEQLIESPGAISPSLEFFVPPAGQGEPQSTYLANQLFLSFGDFGGVVIDRAQQQAPWFRDLARSGLRIARRLQALGYVGHFDLDGIVDGRDRLFLLEVNARRTGGTHAHEFARFRFGAGYAERVTLLCYNKVSSGLIADWAGLQAVLGDLLYRSGSDCYGLVVTVTSALAAHEFGCIIVAPDLAEALALQAELGRRLSQGGGT